MKDIKTVMHDLKSMSQEQLQVAVESFRRELCMLRLQARTSHVKSYSSDQRTLKRAIARGLTFMTQQDKR